jgi:hypothetical protein
MNDAFPSGWHLHIEPRDAVSWAHLVCPEAETSEAITRAAPPAPRTSAPSPS